jgi:hypothetical protein
VKMVLYRYININKNILLYYLGCLAFFPSDSSWLAAKWTLRPSCNRELRFFCCTWRKFLKIKADGANSRVRDGNLLIHLRNVTLELCL